MTVRDSSGQDIPDGGTTSGSNVTAFATDGDHGSGLSRFEVWNGLPTMGGTELTQYRDETNYELDHTYSMANLPEGQVFVRAIDQAGNEVWRSFMIARTPPIMTITNGRGEILDHGAYSDDGHINIHAQHNSAPLRDLEFFPEDASHPKVLAAPGNPDMDFSTDFLADAAWHQVRACDTAGNCVYSTFGIFPPDSNPGNPPGAPPPPGGGGNQRPNPGPGQPMPPRDDPNAPPAPPHQHLALPPPPPPPEECAIPGGCCVGPSCWTPPPPPCRGLACYRGSFCSRYPRRCTMEDQLAHDPNAKYGPAGAVTPGQMMTYTVEFENEGNGLALGTFVKDPLDPALDDTTLALRDMRRVDFLNNTETPASFPWSYDARTRTVTVVTGDADSRKGGRIVLEARLKNDAAPGTIISNKAVVHFPNRVSQSNRRRQRNEFPESVVPYLGVRFEVDVIGRGVTA